MALATGIPSGPEEEGFFYKFITDTNSKREIFLKPCDDRTAQFSAGLHCQAHNQRWTELGRGCLAPRT